MSTGTNNGMYYAARQWPCTQPCLGLLYWLCFIFSTLNVYRCPCLVDGTGGGLCDQPLEMYCPGQCNGHGKCELGFCECDDGWWGLDCAQTTAEQTAAHAQQHAAAGMPQVPVHI